jgi:hypothetical protein
MEGAGVRKPQPPVILHHEEWRLKGGPSSSQFEMFRMQIGDFAHSGLCKVFLQRWQCRLGLT